MSDTRGEKRERRLANRRKMRTDGKSCILLDQLGQRRAEQARRKQEAQTSDRQKLIN